MFLFVFIPWDDCDIYVKLENPAKRGGTLTQYAENPSYSFQGRCMIRMLEQLSSRLWCPPCHVQMHVLQQTGVVPSHHGKSTGPLQQHQASFLLPLIGNPQLPFCSCCHPSFRVTSFHLCVVLPTFCSRII